MFEGNKHKRRRSEKETLINGNNRYNIMEFLRSTYLVTILKSLHSPMTSVYNIHSTSYSY